MPITQHWQHHSVPDLTHHHHASLAWKALALTHAANTTNTTNIPSPALIWENTGRPAHTRVLTTPLSLIHI